TLSAMTSRETRETCIPSCPMEIPSETEMVPNSSGYTPAACTPSLEACASRSSERLHEVITFHEDATPIWRFTQSSSPIPTARSMPRAAVPSNPSVMMRLRVLISGLSDVALIFGSLELLSLRFAIAPVSICSRCDSQFLGYLTNLLRQGNIRSEERRVGKE